MPAQNLRVPHEEVNAQIISLRGLAAEIPKLSPQAQKALAELILIRAHDAFIRGVSQTAYRLACGTSYLDGTPSALLCNPARSIQSGQRLFLEYGRKKPVHSLRWSKETHINKTTSFVLAPGQPFYRALSENSLLISEIADVRNRVAHKNSSSKVEFDKVVRRHYGSSVKTMSPGVLLLATRFQPRKLDEYLISIPLILKSMVAA